MAFTPRIVLVTAPSLEEARGLAGAILEKRLAACVKLMPGVESHYWWQGKLETAEEVQLIAKTSLEQFNALKELVLERHSYICPEIIAISPDEMSLAYRVWWEEELLTDKKD